MEKIAHFLYTKLIKWGVSEHIAEEINAVVLILLLLILLFVVDYLVTRILWKVASKIADKTKSELDDILLANKVSRHIAHLIPLGIALYVVPFILADFPQVLEITIKLLKVIGIVFTLWIVRSVLNSLKDFFKTLPNFKDKPVDSYIQVFMIFAWLAGFVFAFAVITETPIWKFFTVLGATSAIILLIFRDTILGFVASIQVSINDMVRIGDWITFEKYDADGDVVEINLSTVKVQNFDKTITTIPTYALISDSFKNWRGMMDSPGRRIKRSVFVKQKSIHFLNGQEIEELKKIELISSYISTKTDEIVTHNTGVSEKTLAINGRNLTNIGVFRKYIESYIQNHSAINKEMIIMVRQLQPTEAGVPLEVYAFSADKKWENYEYITADIFDHIIASAPYFNLELFEVASGDISGVRNN